MDSAHRIGLQPDTVPHPGETVVEYLEFYGWSQRDLARRTGLTPKTISEICNGKAPITPPTALTFEKVFQRPAHLWLNLQLHFDEAKVRLRQLAKSRSMERVGPQFSAQGDEEVAILAAVGKLRCRCAPEFFRRLFA